MPATSVQKATKPTPRPRTSGDAPQPMTDDAPQPMTGDAPQRTSAVAPQRMSAKEYVALPKQRNGYTYELAQGALVVRDPGTSYIHGRIQRKLVHYLDEWMEKFGRGEVFFEVDFFLSENPETFRTPDVAVILQPLDEENTLHDRPRGAPDIAIEVLSPSNKAKQIRKKTAEYFKAGALHVWIADPETRTVVIHKADGTSVLFEETDILEAPEILPGFTLEVQKIFDPRRRP